MLASDSEDDKPKKGKKGGKEKSPKKSKKAGEGGTAIPPPMERQPEDWAAMPLDYIQQACSDVGLSPEGTADALGIRLHSYYQEL